SQTLSPRNQLEATRTVLDSIERRPGLRSDDTIWHQSVVALEVAHYSLGHGPEDTVDLRSGKTNFSLNFFYQKYRIAIRTATQSGPIFRVLFRNRDGAGDRSSHDRPYVGAEAVHVQRVRVDLPSGRIFFVAATHDRVLSYLFQDRGHPPAVRI